MGQPPHIQSIIPCDCGSHEPYWHGDPNGLREYCCDQCWESSDPRRKALSEVIREVEGMHAPAISCAICCDEGQEGLFLVRDELLALLRRIKENK